MERLKCPHPWDNIDDVQIPEGHGKSPHKKYKNSFVESSNSNVSVQSIKRVFVFTVWKYCGILNLKLTSTQLHKLTSFRKRATKDILRNLIST